MTKKNKKTALSPLQKWIAFVNQCHENIPENEKETWQFSYRGHSQIYTSDNPENPLYKLNPSIFRKEDYLLKEREIIRDLLSRKSDIFFRDKTTFERLIRAQHYELPTRLLDITLSPLVALYFACANWKTGGVADENKEAEIFIFQLPKDKIKYFNSHSVTLRANLALLSESDRRELRRSLPPSKQENPEKLEAQIEHPISLKNLTSLVQNEYPGFRPEIQIKDLHLPVAVYPPQNNERIKAQHGAFILFGLDQTLSPKKMVESLGGKLSTYKIKAAEKKQILEELKRFEIHLSTILLGVEDTAHFLLDQLRKENVKSEDEKRFKEYLKLAETGDKEAQFNLGVIYFEEKDFSKAREYFEKSADQGDAKAQFNLGLMHQNGDDTEPDFSKAREYFEKSAYQGHANAQFNLGMIYLKGEGGEKDLTKARKYLQKAAEQGYAKAQFNLGLMYLKGKNIEQNFAKAREYFQKVAKQGLKEAIEALKELDELEAQEKPEKPSQKKRRKPKTNPDKDEEDNHP